MFSQKPGIPMLLGRSGFFINPNKPYSATIGGKLMLSLLPLFFAKSPTAGADSGGTVGAATSSGTQGNPAQSGAISDVVQISKQEYANLLSAKGYLSSFQSGADKKFQQYETQVQSLQSELERVKQEKPLQRTSQLEQLLSQTGDENDIFSDGNGAGLKQVVMALQSDIDAKLSARDAEIQRLNNDLQKTINNNIIASKTLNRKLNIDDAMNRKTEKLKEEYHISRDEAVEYLNAKEKIVAALEDLKQVSDETIGSSYVDLLDDIIDGVADKKNKLAEHKVAVEKAEQEKTEKIKALLEGDKKPSRTQVTLNLTRQEDIQTHGLSPINKSETREEYAYRQLQEMLKKDLAKSTAGSNRYK